MNNFQGVPKQLNLPKPVRSQQLSIDLTDVETIVMVTLSTEINRSCFNNCTPNV